MLPTANDCGTSGVAPMMRRVASTPATLREVAELAGVHPGTVSRALNSETRDLVNEETAKRVDQAVEELGYRPNRLARGLKMGRSLTVGVVIPDLTNPIFPPIVRGIEDCLGSEGYTALLTNTDGDPERERRGIITLMGRQVDGFILAAATVADAAVDELMSKRLPVVLVNRSVDDKSVPAVVSDDRAGIRAAVAHLADLGHTVFGHLAGPSATSTGRARREAFRAAARKYGLDGHVVRADSFTEAAGAAAAKTLLAEHPDVTAIVAGNDLIALGCLDALHDAGLRCPDDVSLVGFNDMPFVDKIEPPLTTVRIPQYELGRRAAQLLLRRVRNEQVASELVGVELVVRRSTAPPRQR